MSKPNPNDAGRTDPDNYDASPSCGTKEVAVIMGCPNAHAADAATCDVPECDREDVTLDAVSESMFCPYHMKHADTRRCSS